MRLLWVDDDCGPERVLSGLGLFFEKRGLSPTLALDYREGQKALESLLQNDPAANIVLLTDAVLPVRMGRAGLTWNLGMRLADEAAAKGVRKIAILSVVEFDEIRAGIESLRARKADVHYTPKANLFATDELTNLLDFVVSGSSGS